MTQAVNLMEILGNAVTGNGDAGTSDSNDKKKANLFLNPGVDIQNQATGEVEHLPLPFGLAIDTMNEMPIKGNNQEWRQKCAAMNELLRQLVALGEQIKPGEDKEIKGFTLRLRKRSSDKEEVSDDSTYANVTNLISFG